MEARFGPRQIILVLYHFLVLSAPLFFYFQTEELFEFNKIILVYALTILISGAWLWRMIVQKRLIFQRTFLDIPLALFFISQLAATLLSMHPRTSFLGYYTRFHGGLLSMIAYYVLYYAFVSNFRKKDIRPLFLSVFGSALLVSIYGILEHFGRSFSCYLITGGQSFGVDCWVQKVQERVFATFGQPNWLAAYAIMLIPPGMALSADNKSSLLKRSFFALTTVLLFATLLFTRSRSGMLGIAGGLLIFYAGLFLIPWINKHKQTFGNKLLKTGLLKWSIGFTAVFLLLALVFGTPYSPKLTEIGSSNGQEEPANQAEQPAVNRLDIGGTDSGEIRKIVWEGALGVWKRYPLTGSGVETFAYSYYLDRPAEHNLVSEWDFLYNKAHNEFLNYLATTGAFGLFAYTFLLISFGAGLLTALKKLRGDERSQYLLISLLASVAALSISNFFGFSTVVVTALMFLFLAMTAKEKLPDDALSEKAIPKKQELQSWQYGALTVITLVVLMLLSQTYRYWSADIAYSYGKGLMAAGRPQEGILYFSQAIDLSPNEALFYDELASNYASLSVALAQQENTTAAAELAASAIELSNKTLELNSSHLNFYKTRARMFITLSQLNDAFLKEARDTLLVALSKAPTDAKLWYNIGVVELSQGYTDKGIEHLEKAVDLKPDYESARMQLAAQYQLKENFEKAEEQYRYILEEINPQSTEAIENLEAIRALNADTTR